MLSLSFAYYAGLVVTLIIVSIVGVLSFAKVKTSEDFNLGGRRLILPGITGAIVGSFAGGTVTIGTAQMAYQYGIGAIWFTFGAGISCLVLSLFLARPLREKEVSTVTEYLVGEFGTPVRAWVALFSVVGMLIQVAVQVMAAVPVLRGIIPVAPSMAALLTVLLITLYIIGGGVWSTSMVGLVKLMLLSASLFTGGFVSFLALGGLPGVSQLVSASPEYFSLFPRGAAVDLGGFFSVIVGFISTQAFLQPLFSSRDVRSARLGALGASAIIPLYGLAGVAIGLMMKKVHPGINSSDALPYFFSTHLNPWLGGMANATLLISLVLTGGALTLGISTVLTRDIYLTCKKDAPDRTLLWLNRICVAGVGVVVLALVFLSKDSLILDWSYMSNALRGASVFLPLLGAVLLTGRINRVWVSRAVCLAPLATLLWAFLMPSRVHPLFAGLPVALFCMIMGKSSRARNSGTNLKV
ncbi:solute:Na+ symporter, SSS family [Desulfotomaculum arcticum]|uniref:Solute:Na+ symporter, SSS family n=1 Tax=Desulfotruncus arcticus DSM 17038 TaxID=1121424 RepID=A0A1I2VF34_9FIRM|nr:sodium:solute symporter family protein [Desulfotruncus arcticus]SFG87780.1 solute:Na+ symporter, SSS family [Desulfotomaculum arcticum] [Desulfotruncus arcticus DSM 17038]